VHIYEARGYCAPAHVYTLLCRCVAKLTNDHDLPALDRNIRHEARPTAPVYHHPASQYQVIHGTCSLSVR